MGEAAARIDPVTIEEFAEMRFGDRRAELVDGVVIVAQSFPTSRHGAIAAGLAVALTGAIRAGRQPCRAEVGTGLPIRLDRDWLLGPDVTVRCGGDRQRPGEPVLVAEVLSPSNRPPEMDRKLRAYQAVPTLADILLVGQDEHRVEHWTRDADGVWTARIVEGAAATLRLARFDAAWSLEALYGDV